MGQKLVQLQHYLRERLNEKRRARENLADIKEDILKFRQAKEAIWDRASTAATGNKAIWEDNCHKL